MSKSKKSNRISTAQLREKSLSAELSNELSEEHFRLARDVAIGCLYKGNALIRTAQEEPRIQRFGGELQDGWTLPGEISEFCSFLDDGRFAILDVRRCLMRIVDKPVQQGNQYLTSVHEAAWRFAMRIWGAAHTILYVYYGTRPEGIPAVEEEGTFQLESRDVMTKLIEIRDALKKHELIDTNWFSAAIRIESEKAIAEFERDDKPRRISMPLSPGAPLKNAALDEAVNEAWEELGCNTIRGKEDCKAAAKHLASRDFSVDWREVERSRKRSSARQPRQD